MDRHHHGIASLHGNVEPLSPHHRHRQPGDTNPALGRRLNFGTVSDEHESMSAAGFARERLGWWDRGQSAASVIPADKWAQSAVDEASLVGGKVFGVSFSRSGDRVALAGAGRTDAGVHVEVIDGLSGTIVDGVGRLADWLAVRWCLVFSFWGSCRVGWCWQD